MQWGWMEIFTMLGFSLKCELIVFFVGFPVHLFFAFLFGAFCAPLCKLGVPWHLVLSICP